MFDSTNQSRRKLAETAGCAPVAFGAKVVVVLLGLAPQAVQVHVVQLRVAPLSDAAHELPQSKV